MHPKFCRNTGVLSVLDVILSCRCGSARTFSSVRSLIFKALCVAQLPACSFAMASIATSPAAPTLQLILCQAYEIIIRFQINNYTVSHVLHPRMWETATTATTRAAFVPSFFYLRRTLWFAGDWFLCFKACNHALTFATGFVIHAYVGNVITPVHPADECELKPTAILTGENVRLCDWCFLRWSQCC